MDFTIIYVIIGTVGLTILSILCSKFLSKKGITSEQILKGVDISKTIVAFSERLLISMKIEESKIKPYTDIIYDAFEFSQTFSNVSKTTKINETLSYVFELCDSLGIDISDSDLEIIKTVIILTFNMYESIEESK